MTVLLSAKRAAAIPQSRSSAPRTARMIAGSARTVRVTTSSCCLQYPLVAVGLAADANAAVPSLAFARSTHPAAYSRYPLHLRPDDINVASARRARRRAPSRPTTTVRDRQPASARAPPPVLANRHRAPTKHLRVQPGGRRSTRVPSVALTLFGRPFRVPLSVALRCTVAHRTKKPGAVRACRALRFE